MKKLTDRRQVMAIPHMTLWVRWAKKRLTQENINVPVYHTNKKKKDSLLITSNQTWTVKTTLTPTFLPMVFRSLLNTTSLLSSNLEKKPNSISESETYHDRCITFLSDTDMFFALFNLFTYFILWYM